MSTAVMGIADTRLQAETILANLEAAGVRRDDISVLLPDTSGTKDFAHEHSTKAPEGALAGAGAGGALGGALGVLIGMGALAIPGLGPFIAAGPLMAALSGAAAGATLGGLAGTLVGLGIPEIEAKHYEGKIRGGNILIAVHADGGSARRRAETVLKHGGAHDVVSASEAAVPAGKDPIH
jgi:hypothetical protein